MSDTPLAELFWFNEDEIGLPEWNAQVFARAYCGGGAGPFDRVLHRLSMQFSVLVYLPGNCMDAAASLLTDREKGWAELGKPTEDALTVDEFWQTSTSVFAGLRRFWSREERRVPKLIFHNLDLLSDGRGGVEPGNAAKTALHYLVEHVRNGVVLGLSDRDAGELPAPIRRAFHEEVWLDELDDDRLARLAPAPLGERLAVDRALPEGTSWLLASRLRWTDPIRAVRIMDTIGADKTSLTDVLRAIEEQTPTVEYAQPHKLDGPGYGDFPTGYDRQTLELLHEYVIKPYRHWREFAATSREAGARLLRRLPPGLILHGPPGTGKTSLARWVAKSIEVPVRQVSAADLKRSDYGLTEQLVKHLFRSARRAAPCVVVLDDADDLLPDRESIEGSVASAERGIVNAFLQELEGFGDRLEGVLVILTTNRFASLDKAAARRLSLHCPVPYPRWREEVGEIVDTVAKTFELEYEHLRDELITAFMQTTRDGVAGASTEDERVRATEDLFAPRDIWSAMRLLPSPDRLTRAHLAQMLRWVRGGA